MGLSITHIVPAINQNITPKTNPFKTPTNDITNLSRTRQKLSEINSFDWENSVGIGTVLGLNKLRALDFDLCDNYEFIKKVLIKLNLPQNYEWVVKSGSNRGFHILFYAEEHNYLENSDKTKAFAPNKKQTLNFSRLELRWSKHLVLPPSLSKDFKNYSFANCEVPINKPRNVDISLIEELVSILCADENGQLNAAGSGVSLYYDSQTQEYSINEYLDCSPINIKALEQITKDKYFSGDSSAEIHFKNAVANILASNFGTAYKELLTGFTLATCDCTLTKLYTQHQNEIEKVFSENTFDCKLFELDFIRATYYFFVDSDNFKATPRGIYLKSLSLIESYIIERPDEEVGYYIKGRILAIQEKYEEALEQFETSLKIDNQPRVYYRIGRIKESKLEQYGLDYLYLAMLHGYDSFCCNNWFKEISNNRGVKMSNVSSPLSTAFNDFDQNKYLKVILSLITNGSVLLTNKKRISAFECFEKFANDLEKNRSVFINEKNNSKNISLKNKNVNLSKNDTSINEYESQLDRFGINYFYHITHRSNLASIFKNGILSHNEAHNSKLVKEDIADHNVNSRRKRLDPIYGRSLHDYVPLYFNPKNPMLSVRRNIQDELVIIAVDRSLIFEDNAIFTDGNAASNETNFYNSLNELKKLNWNCLNDEFWNDYQDGKRLRCAELLVYLKIQTKYFRKIITPNEKTISSIRRMVDLDPFLPIEVSKTLFFNDEYPGTNKNNNNLPF